MSAPVKLTMTLNLRANEMAYVEERAAECDMSKTAVIRAALRLYQLVNHRLKAGETFSFSGDAGRAALFVGLGFDLPASEGAEPQSGNARQLGTPKAYRDEQK